MARSNPHKPGSFFTLADDDIHSEYGDQKYDDGCLFCALLTVASIIIGAVVIFMVLSAAFASAAHVSRAEVLRHQEAFSGFRTAGVSR